MTPIPAGWKPIESAPKDGTDILLTNGTHVSCGHWHYDEGGTTEYRDLDGRYIGQDDRDGFAGWLDWMGGMTPNPTHWTPLPAAPGAETGAHALPASVAPGDAQAVAWMDPETLDVISAERKASWLSNYGIGGANKAASYTRALGDLHPAPAAGDAPMLPALNADLIEILGRPSFTCAFLAQVLRNGGHTIKNKAEHEQAAVIHFILCQYLAHGPKWREAATSAFQVTAAQQGKGGEA